MMSIYKPAQTWQCDIAWVKRDGELRAQDRWESLAYQRWPTRSRHKSNAWWCCQCRTQCRRWRWWLQSTQRQTCRGTSWKHERQPSQYENPHLLILLSRRTHACPKDLMQVPREMSAIPHLLSRVEGIESLTVPEALAARKFEWSPTLWVSWGWRRGLAPKSCSKKGCRISVSNIPYSICHC